MNRGIVVWAMLPLAVILFSDAARADGCFITASKRDIAEPTQKALIVYQRGVEDLYLSVRYSGDVEDFAWIVPTPSPPRVTQASTKLFYDMGVFTNPVKSQRFGCGGFGGGGLGGGRGGVEALERTQVGIYDTSVLDASDPRALVAWLNGNGYNVSPRIAGVLNDYVQRGWCFTAMRIDLKRAQQSEVAKEGGDKAEEKDESAKTAAKLRDGTIQPIHLTFRSNAAVYPLRISSLNGGTSDLLLYLVTEGRPSVRGWNVSYQRALAAATVKGISSEMPWIERPMWLTKMSRVMPTPAMTDDLVFAVGYN